MTKQLMLLAAVALLTLGSATSCKKVNEATEFDINYSTDVTVPSGSVTVNTPVDFTTPEIPTESSNQFASNKTSKDLIDEITFTKFQVTSQTGNLDFLKAVSVYIKAAGLSDLLIASKSNIPAGSTTVLLDPNGANIKEHIFKDKIQFRMQVTVGTAPASDQKLKLDQTVHVKGKKIK
jgi:hypothetical protein